MNSKHLVMGFLSAAFFSLLAVAAQQAGPAPSKPSGSHGAQSSSARAKDEGELLFEQHCSRCHAAPEGFSPRISGTVVRHMRVRASLSQHEEEALLHYFNP